MAAERPLWITEAEAASLMDMGEAIDALEKGLLAEAHGEAENMVKTHVTWGSGSTLHAIGAIFAQAGFAGTKTWAHTERGATPLLILFDSNTGALKAIIEAFAMGQLRTGAASGVATKRLAAEDADEMAIIGTGKQALTQVAAVAAVRPIKQVRVFGPNVERRERFVRRGSEELGLEFVACGSVAEAVQHAPIITLVTRAKEPFLSARIVASGAHINAMGAIVPSRAEFSGDVLERCSQIVVDSISQAQKLSRELMDYFASGSADWRQVQSLAGIVAGSQRRASSGDLTLFKSLGMGISDLSLGIELYQKALRSGIGYAFVHPQHAAPHLKTTATRSREQSS